MIKAKNFEQLVRVVYEAGKAGDESTLAEALEDARQIDAKLDGMDSELHEMNRKLSEIDNYLKLLKCQDSKKGKEA